jgi:ribosomal protein S18 acetylase RimI-like enzyme
LVAEIDGKVVGYIFCRIVVDAMDVNNLSVDRGFRRRGIAKMLLQECLDIALKGV